MQETTTRRKPWYRLRNIVFGVVAIIVLWLGWAFLQVWSVYKGQSKIMHNYAAEFRKLSEKAAGVPEGGGDEAWRELEEAATTCHSIVKQCQDEQWKGEFPTRGVPDSFDDKNIFLSLVLDGETLPDKIEPEKIVIERLRREGVFDQLGEFARMGPGFHNSPNTEFIGVELVLSLYSAVRELAKARAASMRLALVAGNHAEVARAFNDLLAMCKTVSHQPGIISSLVAQASATLVLGEIRHELLEADFDEATCRALLHSMDQQNLAAVSIALKGEQACFHDILQRTFTHNGGDDGYVSADALPSSDLLGLQNGAPQESFWGAARGRFLLASRQETARKYDEFIEACLKELSLPQANRSREILDADRYANQLYNRYAFAKLMIPSLNRFVDSYERTQQEYEATRVMIALELFHAIHQRWPASLDELAPTFVPQPPRDPLHGGPFGYRVVVDDPRGWPYLLYSTGRDGHDDDGAIPPNETDRRTPLTDHSLKGFDYVFNEARDKFELISPDSDNAASESH